jgi:putative Holliday junction resolvase
MGRWMAIDYGTKRVGIAITDELKIIAEPLQTIHAQDVISFISYYTQQNPVSAIVIGEPKNADHTPAQSAESIQNFVKHYGKKIP